MTHDALIESLLFWKGEPMKVARIAEALALGESEVIAALEGLEKKLARRGDNGGNEGARGVVLVRKDDEVMLGTHPDAAGLLESLSKEELSKDLSKAALETLTVVLYKGPLAKSEIDYIRGVNSGFILRNLLVRGLIERISNPERASGYLYRASFDLLEHLGLSKIEDLPEYNALRGKMEEALTKSAPDS